MILGFLLFFNQHQARAQVNVTLTYSKSASNNCGSCTDCGSVIGCGADQYWETEMNPTGGTYTGNGDNDAGGISNGSFTSTDIGFYCPGGTVQGRVRTCEDDDFGGCGGPLDDCVTGWTYGSVVTINTTTTSVGATAWSLAGGSCTASGTWSLSCSGGWPGNNIVNTTGTTNTTCGTSRYLGNNTSGSLLGGDESVDCATYVWYSYYLTQDLSYLEFDASAKGTFNGCSEDEVLWNTSNTCTGACNIGDDYGIGYWGINNPRQGYYFIRVSMPTTVSGRQYDFTINVNKGSVVTRPGNDDFCNATSISGSFNYNSAGLNPSGNTEYATSQDYCGLNEPDNSGNRSLWWKFTTSATPPAIITIDPNANGWDCTGYAAAYTGTLTCPFPNITSNQFSGLTKVGESSVGLSFDINCPAANTTYYIQGQVGGLCTSGDKTMAVSVVSNGAPKPTNDLCAGATDLGTLTAGATIGNSSGSNRWNNFCSGTAGDPNPGWTLDNNIRQSVWFKFNTGSVGRLVDIEAYNDPSSWGDQIDLKIGLYKGPCGSLTYVDRDYDPGFFSESMSDLYCLSPNTDYYVLIDGSGLNTQGFFGLTVRDRGPYPANDFICGATTIANQTIYTYNSTTLGAESNVRGSNCFEPNPDWTFETGQDNDHGIWYYLGQVPGRTVVVDANSSGGDNIDLEMALYSSTSAKGACVTPGSSPTLTEVQKEYAGAGLIYDEDAYFNCLDPSKYYWLMIDGSAGPTSLITALEEGVFSIRIWNPEEGEITGCAAENLGTVPTAGSITIPNLSNICGAGSIANFPAPSSFTFDKAVVYRFTTPAAPGYTDASVKIEGFTNPYYSFSSGGNMDPTFLLAGDEIDLQLALYSPGTCSSSHFVVGSNYDVTVGTNVRTGSDESLIVNCLTPSTEYYLVVDGGVNTNGYYDLKISDYGKHTTNDLLCNAIDITATNSAPWTNCNSNTQVTLTGQNNYCATTNNDIPSSLGLRPPAWAELNGPVWYKFKAPKSGKLFIEAINTVSDVAPPFDEPEIGLQLAVFFLPGGYQGGACPTGLSLEKERLQYIASDYDGILHDEDFTVECLMPDSIYYLLVDGSSYTLCPGCTRGEFYLRLTADPQDRRSTNDLICDAIDLGTPVMGTTIVDTKVPPAGGAATNPSPATGYPASSPATLHGSPRTGTGTCMRAENNFCAGITGEPAVSGGTFFSDFSPDATVWYKFTAPATGEVRIDTYSDPDSRGDMIYTQIAVFETSDNTCTGTMVGIATQGIPNLINGNNNLTVKCLDPGKTYFLMVDGAGININGYFELQIQAVAATQSSPANNDICNATTVAYPGSIGATTSVSNQTNRCATIQNVYSEPTTFTKDADVWYKFTTPNTAGPHAVEVTVTSGLPWPFGDAMDPQIALYKGSCPSSFTLVDDDYSVLGLPFIESFEFHCLEQNTTYYLMVDGSGLNEQGNFSLDVKRITPHPLAGNDNICSVVSAGTGSLGTLGASTGNKIGNTTTNWHNFCSSVESGEPALITDGNYTLDQTVWFKFTTPNTANNIDVEIRALNDPNNVGDQIDLQMLLVQGSGCAPFTSLSPIESVDPLLTFDATMNVCLPPNTTFYINVDGSGLNKQGYFTLEIENKGSSTAPANDNICNAKVLPSGGVITNAYTGYLNDNNNCATLEANEKQQAAGSIQRSVWYKFVCPTSADVSIEVKGNSFVPFTTNYFLPDVTIWEVNDGTFASPATTIAGCAAPTLAQWNKLEFNDYQGIPNSLANGLYPTVVFTPLCLKPNYTYYVQVDGIAGVGLDGYFDIRIKNNQVPYTAPANNEASGAAAVPISSASCQLSNGVWQGAYSFGTNPTWSNPSLIGISNGGSLPSCTQNCGDVWYKFQMPAACGNNTKSFIKIEGDDEFNLDLDGYPELAIAAYNGGQTTSTSSLSYMKCSIGGTGVDPDFSISANPNDWIYLQIWDLSGNEQGKTFKLCVSEQKSADDCVDATNMTLDLPYCWSIESHTGETPSSGVPGSGLTTCFGSGTPQHSTYFKFTTDAANNFCDDYFIYINTAALAKLLPSGADHACLAGATSSVSLNMSLWELKAAGTSCTPGVANVTLEDCQTWNDCGGGSFGANTTGPHGNGGVVNDSIWYNLASGQELKPNTTYYIVLDYNIDNVAYESRVILDGTITVGRRCKGRVWEYTTAPQVSTSNYCVSRDGWQNYYDDKGTPATADDRYIFSVFPNGNNIKGTAKVTLNNNFYTYEDNINRFGEYVMRRRWDFVMSSGFNTINPANPVKVRFYYQNSEKQEVITAAQTFATNKVIYYEDFEWFKSTNGHEFDPVTDVNARVISVGPNGYSETGCLSYWDATGMYVGPPGIQRCSTKVITDWDDGAAAHEWCNGVHFCEYTGLTGFSGGTGGAGASPFDASPLPVELSSFTGYNNGSENVLNWITASEINTLKYEVEKSTDGKNFVYIGERPAAGNSNAPLSYGLIDPDPVIGNNYYRLKLINMGGTFEYSNVINIKVTDIDAARMYSIISVYPNPTNGLLNVVYQASTGQSVNLDVYNAIGENMLNKTCTLKPGINNLAIDVTAYPKGVYILYLKNTGNGEKHQTKFVKE